MTLGRSNPYRTRFLCNRLCTPRLWSGRCWRIQQASAKGQHDLSYDRFTNSPITRVIEPLRGRTAKLGELDEKFL